MFTCGEVTGRERTHDVHHAERDHLLVAVDLFVLDHGQASSHGYSFLRTVNTYIYADEKRIPRWKTNERIVRNQGGRTASARIPDKRPAFIAISKFLVSNTSCEMEIGLIPFFRSPTCFFMQGRTTVRQTLKQKRGSEVNGGASTYNWDAMLISLDKESKDASDNDHHERRNGRHPEQMRHLLSL